MGNEPLNNKEGFGLLAGGIGCLGIVVVGIGCLFLWGCPNYNVYKQTLAGQGLLKEAESSRQIAVEEAKAKLESAKLLANAEVERAKGVAEANKIIGEGLKGHEEYLVYLWIQALGDKENHVIYVPTEANIPILEASRFSAPLRDAPPKEK